MTEEETNNIQERGSDPEHIKQIYAMLKDLKPKESVKTEAIPETPKNTEREALHAEQARLYLLQQLPPEIQSEFKESTYDQIQEEIIIQKKVDKRRKQVGETPPKSDSGKKKEIFGWNPMTRKNEWHSNY
jgi:hypothetical protein